MRRNLPDRPKKITNFYNLFGVLNGFKDYSRSFYANAERESTMNAVRRSSKPIALWVVTASVMMITLLSTLFVGTVPGLAQTVTPPAVPSIASDRIDYAPGDTVILTGTGWQAGEAVSIYVSNDSEPFWELKTDLENTPVADGNGSFTFTFDLPNWFVALYYVTATGSSGSQATTTFNDSEVKLYDQCSNDLGLGYSSGGKVGCEWINGNLNANNSTYYEGDATVQRAYLIGMTPGSTGHTITFKYGTTKGGKHAYDYLTTYNFSEDWVTLDDRCENIAGCTNATETTKAMQLDANTKGLDDFARLFVMRGGTLKNISAPTLVSGSYTGDSETAVTITFDVDDTTNAMCTTKNGVTTCGVAIWFGAHVARSDQWTSGGASTVPGSPYHVAVDSMDGTAIGQRDNQMQSNTIVSDLMVSKTAFASYTRTYKWLIDKSVDQTKIQVGNGTATFNYSVKVSPNGYTDSAWVVNGEITVQNPNVKTTIVADITDVVNNGGTCVVTGGTQVTVPKATLDNKTDVLTPGEVTRSYTCTYTAAPNPLDGLNIATATWSRNNYGTPHGSASGSAQVKFSTATITETNKTITVKDDKTNPANPVTLGTWNWVDGEHTFTYALVKDGVPGQCVDFTNTAWIVETSQSDPQTVTVCAGLDLTVSKTATASFDRKYLWNLSKDVNATDVKISGGTYTFTYTVKAWQTGIEDSNWKVVGKITISNPNPFAVEGVSVTDAINNGGVCTVTSGTNVTVPAKAAGVDGTALLDYECTYSSAPNPAEGRNTATASWNKDTYKTPTGTASGIADVDFNKVTPKPTNKTIHVTDSYKPGEDILTLTATDAAPWTSGEYKYDRIEGGASGTCTSYDNTAKITELSLEAKKTVKLCVGADLTVTKTASGTFNRTYLWKIAKDVDNTKVDIAQGGSYTFHYTVTATQTGISDSGWTLAGKVTITNPNDWEDITLTSLTDAVDNGGSCTVDAGPYVVAKSGSLDVNYSCAYSSAPSSYSGTNTATATWNKDTAFTPTGSASGSKPFTLSQAGATNKTIHVTDSYGGDLGTVTATDSAPFATGTFTYERTESGVAGTCTKYDNTATITETGANDSKTVTLCVGKDLTVSKTAAGTFNRTYLWSIAKDVDKTKVDIAAGGSYTFHYSVTVTQTGVSDSGWTLAGNITITNPNDWEDITLTSLSDTVDNGGACTVAPGPYVVTKSGSLNVNYSCAYSSAPTSYSGTNTATATWDKDAAFTPNGSAIGSKPFTLSQASATNKTIHVTDSYKGSLGTVTANDAAPWAKVTFTYERTESGVAGTCTKYDNTATITETGATASKTVTLCVGKDLTVTKTAAGTFNRTYLWTIAKDVDKTTVNIAEGGSYTFHYTVTATQTGVSDSGWTLAGKITITNPNDWEDITLTSLSDTVDNGGACTVAPGPYVITKSGSLDVNYSCAYSSAPTSYSGTNTATANWNKATAFTPNSSASGSKAFTLSQAGATNQTIHVTDSYAGNLGTVTATDSAPFAKGTFTYERTESGVAGTCTKYDNTATITETGTTASKTVTLCVGKDLTVSKTAAGTFNRTYLWTIAKSVDKTTVTLMSGNATFNYTVDVAQTGFSDGGWTLSGKITIKNPNDWEDITLASLADVVNNGGTCTVAPAPYTIAAGKSLEVSYTCSYALAPSSYEGKNTATATWDKEKYATPNGSASGSADFTLGQLGSVNKTIHVTDSFQGDLGTLDATDKAPFAAASYTYSRTVPVPDSACVTYDNTAMIKETGQKASVTVQVCKPSLVTDSMLCTLTNDQLKLIYTPDQSSGWKLGASNPGQFYYNVFYTGAGNETITLTLPYPWITQGNVPIHAYSSVTANVNSLGQTCLTPGSLLPNPPQSFVTMQDYGVAYKFDDQTHTVTVQVPPTPTGFIYLNIHLDYGLKGTTGYAKGGSGNDAVSYTEQTKTLIPDLQQYTFSDTYSSGFGLNSHTVTSVNAFKRDPGIGGMVFKSDGVTPASKIDVSISQITGGKTANVTGTVTTDEDGWYMWQYKWTGKAVDFTVKPTKFPALVKTVTLKANGYLVVNFTLP